MDTFSVLGVGIACIGVWLLVGGVYTARRSEVTLRDIERWRWRSSKHGFSVPRNLSLDSMVAFVRAWRRRKTVRNLGLGIGFLTFGTVVTVYNALQLTSKGGVVEALFQYLGIVLYPALVTCAYLGISRLSRSQRAGGQTTSQRPLRDYRYVLVPALCISLLLVYVALLILVMAQLTHSFDPESLAHELALPDVWGVFFGVLVMLVAIFATEVVVRRIVALPSIPFPPAGGWERIADYVLRNQAIGDCYGVTWFVLFMAVFVADFPSSSSLIARSGLDGWYQLYVVLLMLAGLVIIFLTQSMTPSPSPTWVDATQGTSTQPQQ